jgi:hypothetical protein
VGRNTSASPLSVIVYESENDLAKCVAKFEHLKIEHLKI